ncbi:N-acetylneuraminate synthase family protein [Thermospira aquatica]|uniref:N-acetylneuraminate synthase family protein n=1 Tax=Thermospira aquatica TaxID=2828656 RepID=A0AAX3BC96_9SPIR|nr:N-acetylneuraminate synthase family protein [Thermospira aquatica]URA09761.1 N-acetylneuraminate synthase family protein [Thermospira aquatica]
MEWLRAFDPRDSRVLVTAEIGINHLGREEYAYQLIDEAMKAGADAVKFQIYRTQDFYHPDSPAYEIFEKYELSLESFSRIKAYCEKKGILFFATPLDFGSLQWMMDQRIPLIKVASSDITFEPFLKQIGEYVRRYRAYAILSTGFVKLEEIGKAVRFFPRQRLALLYCVSRYPTEASDLDLSFLKRLRQTFGTTVGFSDHSLETVFSVAAVALGARIIERHFTDNSSLQEADHSISLNPEAFGRMVEEIRKVEIALGKGEKKITDFEQKIRPLSMRDLYAARDIRKGEMIGKNDIKCLRPGEGISLARYKSIVGQKARQNYAMNERI